MPSRPMFTCETTQDRPLRSEYVHVMGVERLGGQLLNYFPPITNLISVSPSLYRVEVQEFLALIIRLIFDAANVFCKLTLNILY